MSLGAVVRELFKPKEPEVNFNFLVFVGSAPFGCFKSISEFAYSTPKKEFLVGGRLRSHEMAFDDSKGASWGNVTLKWGNSSLSTLQAWSQAVRVGGHFRREVFIFQLSRAWEPTRIFHLHGAWPVKWTADGFDGDSGTTPWTVTGVELSFKTMNMVLPGLNLLRAGGLPVPDLGMDQLLATTESVLGLEDGVLQHAFGDTGPERWEATGPTEDEVDDSVETQRWEAQRLAALEQQHDMGALARAPITDLTSDQLAALAEHRQLEKAIATQTAARLADLTEEITALDAKVLAMESELTQSGALTKSADDLSDAEFAAVNEYQNSVSAKADAEAEKADLEAGG